MITNDIVKIEENEIILPVLVKSEQEGWVPTFELWKTKINSDTSAIDCKQNFRTKLKHYEKVEYDPSIGYYNKDGNLVINWKTLISTESRKKVNEYYGGKLRACVWQKRYCTYFSLGSSTPWLHSVVLDNFNRDGYVVHHINGVSLDNRLENLHILPKREHDSIDHPGLDVRKIMFEDPNKYWERRRNKAINEFIKTLSLIIYPDFRNKFIADFAKENLDLASIILAKSKLAMYFKKCEGISKNRKDNKHLSNDYLDCYEMEKYLKRTKTKNELVNQIRMF